MNCDQAQLTFGGYALGLIDPAERAEVDRHLEDCRCCREELDGLIATLPLLDQLRTAGVEPMPAEPGLNRPDPVPVEPVGPSAGLLDRTLAAAARQHRRVRRMIAFAAAAVLIIFAGVSVVASGVLPGRAPAQAVTWTAADRGSGVRAEARLAPTSWGTEITLQLAGVPVGTDCSMVIVSRDGERQPAGTWRAVYYGSTDVTVPTSFSITEVESLVITDGNDDQLLRISP